MGDGYEDDVAYRRRQSRRLPWQVAGILAFFVAIGAASAQLWIITGVMALGGAGLLTISLFR